MHVSRSRSDGRGLHVGRRHGRHVRGRGRCVGGRRSIGAIDGRGGGGDGRNVRRRDIGGRGRYVGSGHGRGVAGAVGSLLPSHLLFLSSCWG